MTDAIKYARLCAEELLKNPDDRGVIKAILQSIPIESVLSQLSQREVQLDKCVQLAEDWEVIAKRSQEQLSTLEQKNAQNGGVLLKVYNELDHISRSTFPGTNFEKHFRDLFYRITALKTAVHETITPSDAYVRKEAVHEAVVEHERQALLIFKDSLQQARIEELEWCITLLENHSHGYMMLLRQRLEQLKKGTECPTTK